MKRKLMSALMACFLVGSLMIPAAIAAGPRAIGGRPSLSISGTTATCVGKYDSGDLSDEIDMTLTLKQGRTTIQSWKSSGEGSVRIVKTCTVERGKTYELVLEATVNGKEQPSSSVTARA